MRTKNYTDRKQVAEGLEKLIGEIEELQKLDEPQEDENYREPLSIESIQEVKILLSWGGPEDGFKLQFSRGNDPDSGVYYRADWGTYEEVPLNDDELSLVFSFYLYGERPSGE